MSTSKFFKDNKNYYNKFQEKSCYYLIIMYMEKHVRYLRQTKFWKHARAVCNFHLYYIRMRSFSFNQKRASSTWTWLSPEYLVHFLFSLVFNYYVSISGSFRFRCYSIITSVSYTLSSICYRIITSVFCTFLVFHPDCDASISGTFALFGVQFVQ